MELKGPTEMSTHSYVQRWALIFFIERYQLKNVPNKKIDISLAGISCIV